MLFDNYLEAGVHFVRKELREVVTTVDSNLCFSLLRLLDCFMAPFAPHEGAPPPGAARLAALPTLL